MLFCDYADNAKIVTDFGPNTPPARPLFIATAQNSVTMFFVLSDFVLTFVYRDKIKNKSSYKNYLLKRFARIAPVY